MMSIDQNRAGSRTSYTKRPQTYALVGKRAEGPRKQCSKLTHMWTNGDAQPEISGSAAPDCSGDMQALIDEMRVQDFDSIRFATYRAACKLRFIQKKTNVHLVDIWNMIESFRENGLNAMPIHTQATDRSINSVFDKDCVGDDLCRKVGGQVEVLALTTAVFEAPTFGFSEAAVSQCFVKDQRVTLNNFLDVFMSDPCPPCVMWLPLLHRMASVEHVYHPVVCDACQKSPTKQLAHSIHKSLQCIPTANTKQPPLFAERPQRPLELQNIVPATPTTLRRAPPDPIPDWPQSPILLPGQVSNGGALDDEHKLIARYSAKLSGRADYPLGNGRDRAMTHPVDERTLIARLEEENSHMMREISRLESQTLSDDGQLTGLRERKSQLEEKMFVMQQKRRDLMMQLEQLMTQLNAPGTAPFPSASMSQIPESLSGVNTKVSNAFRAGSVPATSLQGDLLHAADQITTNMGEFLRELDQAQQAQETPTVTNGHYMI
ncbi:EF-hand [Teladorsagia circumcincta]|uniref:EF-hand n=1 Tax=Teladorsagia circumcincta TaxID=45464 RepID=A0A2G9V0Z4_TELCI|nr:EF-hand [Teladorsagia circumcincta]